MIETIQFTGATGSFLIDMSDKQRQTLFGNTPSISVYNYTDDPETDVKVPGVGLSKTFNKRILSQILLDGVNGNGYITISRK